MKTLFYTAVILFFYFGCSKRHENDPWTVIFKSLKNRIEGKWEMKKIIINGNDSTFLIETTNYPFYSVYSIKIYDKSESHLFGNLEIETINRNYKVGKERGLKVKILKNKTRDTYPIEVKFYANQWDSIPEIKPHGLINLFFEEYHLEKITRHWDVTKLTSSDFHINSTDHKNSYYEIQFKKKKK